MNEQTQESMARMLERMERIAQDCMVGPLSMRRVKEETQILYFGDWQECEDPASPRQLTCDQSGAVETRSRIRRCNVQGSAFEFAFRGSAVRWIGTRGPDQGVAEVFVDGESRGTVDNYAADKAVDVVKFEATGIGGDRIHTLRVVVTKERHDGATGCFQDVAAIEAAGPVSYPAEISHAMFEELARIRTGTKPHLDPARWAPVAFAAQAPERGVTLGPGLFRDLMERNIAYLNHCFASPTYVDGIGWSRWLPASIEGFLLAGAGHTLRWGERGDLRAIVEKIVGDIGKRMRADGYYNYYPEEDSFALNHGRNSERKNYDRVFWTRGMLAAGRAGHPKAYELLRRMYDWFNASPYLPDMLFGGNATNGMPGGPLVYFSPVGREQDLVTTLRYYDQDYWMRELSLRQPLALSHYPGERPHCYDLLGVEMMADEYRATGDRKYLDAVLGAWDVYRDNFKHIGGATAIMESQEVYPPKSYYFADKMTGETCGSVFWIYINQKLLQLFPGEERFAAEIEEAIYNIVAAAQDQRGYIRYHNRLHNRREKANCAGTCCEVSTAGLLGQLPEYIYSLGADKVFVNLYATSELEVRDGLRLKMTSAFPSGGPVSIRLSAAAPTRLDVRIRVPSWADGPVAFTVNGRPDGAGEPGTYRSFAQEWREGDTIAFTLPMGFKVVKYMGLDQLPGNVDRCALLHGPLLLALRGDLGEAPDALRLRVSPQELPGLLSPADGSAPEFDVKGFPGHRYVPYWAITDEPFTCFPAVQP